MKNLSKLLAVAILSAGLLFTGRAMAQTTPPSNNTSTPSPVQVNLGLEGGLVAGDGSNVRNASFGGTLQLEKFTGPSFAMTLTSGYYHLFGKTAPNGVDYDNLNIIPAKLGVKMFFIPNIYFGAEGGAAFVLSNGNVKFIGSPAIGYVGPDHKWDISLRYENFFGTYDFGIFGLRLAHSL